MIIIVSVICFLIGIVIGYFIGAKRVTSIQVSGDNSVQTQVNVSDKLVR